MSINISSYSNLGFTPVNSSAALPFMDKSEPQPFYRIYNDGNHYVASLCVKKNRQSHKRGKSDLSYIDILFDSLYFEALKNNLRYEKLSNYIKEGLAPLFPERLDLDDYIEKRLEYKLHLLYLRKKRFRRKAHLNNWTHFVTFTYDENLCSEDTFRKKLRRCLSNLHTRHGWRYMGVFERAPETNRLHFHGIFYIPQGEMVGKIKKETYYSVEHQKLQVSFNNSFFAARFGRCDFKPLNDALLKSGEAIDYILKYITKDNGRVIYSRNIASELCKALPKTEIVTEFVDFVAKFVLFDNTISWEKDIMQFTPKQLSFFPDKKFPYPA